MTSDSIEAALDHYVEARRNDGLTDTERGVLDLRIAECYLGLLRLGSEEAGWLQEQIVGSLESAAALLLDARGFDEVQALLIQLSQEDWWDAAVERQQS
jgi:hypothetical protein